jgi:hypothetical protein
MFVTRDLPQLLWDLTMGKVKKVGYRRLRYRIFLAVFIGIALLFLLIMPLLTTWH